jgi:hypothetical protein
MLRASGAGRQRRTEPEKAMLPRFVLMSLLLLAVPAQAFDTRKLGQLGSLTSEEKQALFAKSPKLDGEAAAAMSKLGKRIDDIHCDGMRFPGPWKEIGGLRVSPYLCEFGERWLQIRTKVVVTGKRGKVYEQITREAMQRATDVRETDPTWTWSDTKPAQP